MPNSKLPITELDISIRNDRMILSPVRINNLSNLGINQNDFINFFSKLFEELSWDEYDPKRLRIKFLKEVFPNEEKELNEIFPAYFTGKVKEEALQRWIEKLTLEQRIKFDSIQPWRRRSISQFLIQEKENTIQITREPVQQFSQDLDSTDFRSLPRIFEESPAAHVENDFFNQFIEGIFRTVQAVQPIAKKVRMVAHFMSVKSTIKNPGDNSPEGAHEDGADFIVSALVINRINVEGAESQIIEELSNGKKEIIYSRILQPGEFAFQADTGEEKTYGNDLWHHVTPFYVVDKSKGDGWRDIIGFDINVIA